MKEGEEEEGEEEEGEEEEREWKRMHNIYIYIYVCV